MDVFPEKSTASMHNLHLWLVLQRKIVMQPIFFFTRDKRYGQI